MLILVYFYIDFKENDLVDARPKIPHYKLAVNLVKLQIGINVKHCTHTCKEQYIHKTQADCLD